jgi:hypothetical protein
VCVVVDAVEDLADGLLGEVGQGLGHGGVEEIRPEFAPSARSTSHEPRRSWPIGVDQRHRR